jgi:hypothetical protein
MVERSPHDGELRIRGNKDPSRPFGAPSPQGGGIVWGGGCARQMASAEKGLSVEAA